jgi:CRP-like cAMP-binding protein
MWTPNHPAKPWQLHDTHFGSSRATGIPEESTVAASGLTLAPEAPETRIEDVLAHLPMSRIRECGNGQVIYGPEYPSTSIYLLVAGKVRISQFAADGTEVLLDIIRPEEIFGESAFLDSRAASERATAAETCKVMSWEVSDMEKLVTNRPRLAVALLQVFAQRNAQAALRIESFATDTIEQRLARSLLHFAARLGTLEPDGTERMMPLTHVLLSQYVGTSREIVTHYMTRFRTKGYVQYSRLGIVLYRSDLQNLLA